MRTLNIELQDNGAPDSPSRPESYKRSAFEVLMKNQAKWQRLERSGCPAPESGSCSGSRSPSNETDEGVNKQLSRFNKFVPEYNEESPSENEDEECQDDKSPGKNRTIISSQGLPNPREEPTPGAKVCKIKIHRAANYSKMIMGFTFVYSDGTSKSCGNIRGTTESYFVNMLDDDDYIVKVRPIYHESRPRFLQGIEVLSKLKDKWSSGKKWAYYGRERDELTLEEGRALHFFDWDDYEQRIRALETVAIDSINLENPMKKSKISIPSLTSLSKKAIENYFVSRSNKNEYYLKNQTECYRRKMKGNISKIYDAGKSEVCRSEEAEEVRKLRAELEIAEQNLTRKTNELLRDANEKVDKEVLNFKTVRSNIKSAYKAEKAEINANLKEYCQNLRDCCQVTENQEGESAENHAVCTSPTCHKIFDWTSVSDRMRCSKPGCSTRYPSCGCNVDSCRRCHETFCTHHRTLHEYDCKKTRRHRCGYDEESDRIHPMLCGCDLKDKEVVECYFCEVECCPECHDACDRCGQKWCCQCLEPCSQLVPMACCDNCPFLRDMWR